MNTGVEWSLLRHSSLDSISRAFIQSNTHRYILLNKPKAAQSAQLEPNPVMTLL
jgi:hypothetical protein